ncbi:MAG: hypothetical protein GOV02_00885 [Candidatus Aenigmarchaeota archaeon]|nr:hypothetical protein [Candidatus Aenigmarchaeota archaeon]
MTITGEEREILNIISTRGLIRKSELASTLNNNGLSASFGTVNTLVDKGMVATLSPLGELSYALTRSGMQFLREE